MRTSKLSKALSVSFLLNLSTLVACQPGAEALIGPMGGELTNEDGVRLIFPAGALSRDTVISTRKAPAQREWGAGPAYVMEPEGITFGKPVRIRLPYLPQVQPGEDLSENIQVFRAPGGSDSFNSLGGTVVAPGMVEAETPGFSTFLAASGSPTLISSTDAWPQGLAVTDTHVYWSNYGTTNLPSVGNDGNVMRAQLDYPSLGQIGNNIGIAWGQMDPKQIAVVGTDIYWTNGGSGRGLGDAGIMRMPTTGGAATRIVTAPFPVAIAADATYIYWLDAEVGSVNRANRDGTNPVLLCTTAARPSSIAVDATHVYFSARGTQGIWNGAVAKVPIAGGSPTVLVGSQLDPYALTINGTHVYFVNRGNGQVWRVNKSGFGATVLRTLQRPSAIAVDPTYYFVGESGTGRILRYPLSGGGGVVRVSGAGYIGLIQLDDYNIFWVNQGSSKYTGDVKVIRK